MESNFLGEMFNSIKSFLFTFLKKIFNILKSAKLITFVCIVALIILFRNELLQFSVHFIVMFLLIILCFLLYIAFRLFVFVSPVIGHLIRQDLIKLGFVNRIEITGKLNRSLLLENKFIYCKDELDILEEGARNFLTNQSGEEIQKIEEVHRKRIEIESKITDQIKILKNLFRDLGQIEKEYKNLFRLDNRVLAKRLIEKSFNLLLIILSVLAIPIIIYLIYILLKMLNL